MGVAGPGHDCAAQHDTAQHTTRHSTRHGTARYGTSQRGTRASSLVAARPRSQHRTRHGPRPTHAAARGSSRTGRGSGPRVVSHARMPTGSWAPRALWPQQPPPSAHLALAGGDAGPVRAAVAPHEALVRERRSHQAELGAGSDVRDDPLQRLGARTAAGGQTLVTHAAKAKLCERWRGSPKGGWPLNIHGLANRSQHHGPKARILPHPLPHPHLPPLAPAHLPQRLRALLLHRPVRSAAAVQALAAAGGVAHRSLHDTGHAACDVTAPPERSPAHVRSQRTALPQPAAHLPGPIRLVGGAVGVHRGAAWEGRWSKAREVKPKRRGR
jgi:hypothetical protein